MGKRKKSLSYLDDPITVNQKACPDSHVCIRQEPDDDDENMCPEAWSVDSVQKANKLQLNPSNSVSEIGLQLARGIMEAMQKKSNKKSKGDSIRIQLKPTPIQLNMWPQLLNSLQLMSVSEDKMKSKNVIAISQTGSGKTLSYCLPVLASCIHKLLSRDLSGAATSLVHGIVLCPTRELAIQVSSEMKVAMKVANKMIKVADTSNGLDQHGVVRKLFESVAIYGGAEIQSQLTMLGHSQNANIDDEPARQNKALTISATPGRLLDILKQIGEVGRTIFRDVAAIIFDEADRMALNVEMSKQIDEVLEMLQTVNGNRFVRCLVSATLPQQSREVIDRWVPCRRVTVKIDSVKVADDQAKKNDRNKESTQGTTSNNSESKHKLKANLDLATIPSNLVQTLHVCANHKKPKKLITILKRVYQNGSRSSSNKLCIVFFAQIKTLKLICNLLRKEGFRCTELFGTLKQDEREQRLLSFRAGKFPILLASDLASRGIHVPNVHYVINYDFPGSLDQYVHRCGRAGRNQPTNPEASNSNPPTVFSFFTREFSPMADSVIELLRICNAHVDPNLIALSSKMTKTNDKANKKQRKNGNDTCTLNAEEQKAMESDEDQFSNLGSIRIVLKRASHVSDAEDSDD